MYKPSVICVVESWLDSSIEDIEITIQGYKTVWLDHTRHGSGLIIYVNTSSVVEFLMLSLASHRKIVNNPEF